MFLNIIKNIFFCLDCEIGLKRQGGRIKIPALFIPIKVKFNQ